MTRDDVIRMARETGHSYYSSLEQPLHDFAAAIRDAALEEAAKKCQSEIDRMFGLQNGQTPDIDSNLRMCAAGAAFCAAAIRAMKGE